MVFGAHSRNPLESLATIRSSAKFQRRPRLTWVVGHGCTPLRRKGRLSGRFLPVLLELPLAAPGLAGWAFQGLDPSRRVREVSTIPLSRHPEHPDARLFLRPPAPSSSAPGFPAGREVCQQVVVALAGPDQCFCTHQGRVGAAGAGTDVQKPRLFRSAGGCRNTGENSDVPLAMVSYPRSQPREARPARRTWPSACLAWALDCYQSAGDRLSVRPVQSVRLYRPHHELHHAPFPS